MSKVTIDLSRRQLTLLDARFYFDEKGNYLPSVTTILNAYPKGPEYYMWLKKVGADADEIRDEAGRRGSTVHYLTEKYDEGEEVSLLNDNGGMNFSMTEWKMFENYVEFMEKHQPEVILSEQTIISETYAFAGTIDRIIKLNGRYILIDIKTSSSIWDSYWLQLAAYKKMAEKELSIMIDQVAILWLNAKTRTEGKNGAIQGAGWQLAIRESKQELLDWELFCHTQVLWLSQNRDLTPKNVTYQTSHKKTL